MRGGDRRWLTLLLIANTSVFAARPTASYRTLELGGSPAVVGLVAASYAALAMVFALPAGRMIDRIGPRRFLLGGMTTLTAGCFIGVVSENVALLAGSQALVGLGQLSTVLSLQTVTAESRELDANFARLTVAGGLGQIAGPLIAGWLLDTEGIGGPTASGSTSVFGLTTILGVVGVLVVLMALRSDPARWRVLGREHAVPLIRSVLRRSGMAQALTVSITMAISVDLLTTYLPVLGEARGISPGTIGIFLALRAGFGLVSRVVMPSMLRVWGKRRLLPASMIGTSLGLLGMVGARQVWIVGAVICVVGFGLGIGAPMTMAWVAIEAPEGGRGTAMAVRLTAIRLSQVVVPAAAGALAVSMGAGAVFVALAGALSGGSFWAQGPDPDRGPNGRGASPGPDAVEDP